MPTLLAIETSTELASVALLRGEQVISVASAGVATHSQSVLPLIQQLLSEAGIALSQCDALAFGAGPGSFTGVRTACGIVQGLAFGAGLPVVPVGTLLAMALACQEAGGGNEVLAVLDARMDEVYWAQYRYDGAWREVMRPSLSSPSQVSPLVPAAAGTALAGCGNGLMLLQRARLAGTPLDAHLPATAWTSMGHDIMPHAIQVARLAALAYGRGEALAARDAQPVYLRNRVALTTLERQQVQVLAQRKVHDGAVPTPLPVLAQP